MSKGRWSGSDECSWVDLLRACSVEVLLQLVVLCSQCGDLRLQHVEPVPHVFEGGLPLRLCMLVWHADIFAVRGTDGEMVCVSHGQGRRVVSFCCQGDTGGVASDQQSGLEH